MLKRISVVLAFMAFASPSFAQVAMSRGGGGSSSGTSTITSGTSATSGCVAGGVLRSISNLVECGAGITWSGGTFTLNNGASAVSPMVVQDNGVTKFQVADGGSVSILGTASTNPFTVTIGGSEAQKFDGSSGRAIFGFGLELSSGVNFTAGAGTRVQIGGLTDNALGLAASATDLWLGGDSASGDASRGVYLAGWNGSAWSTGLGVENVTTGGPKLVLDRTVTAGGTTGARTIDKIAGSVNFAAAATTLVVTNSLAGTSSLIFLTPQTADTACTAFSAVRAAGSFTITANAACAAETAVAFWVTN